MIEVPQSLQHDDEVFDDNLTQQPQEVHLVRERESVALKEEEERN